MMSRSFFILAFFLFQGPLWAAPPEPTLMDESEKAFHIDPSLKEDLRRLQEKEDEAKNTQSGDAPNSVEEKAHTEGSTAEEELAPRKIRIVTIRKSVLERPWARPKNSLYLELSGLVFAGGASLNYERFFSDNFGLRLSYQASYAILFIDVATGHGPSLALLGVWGGKHAFELNGGLSFTSLVSNSDVFSGTFTVGLDKNNRRGSYLLTPLVYAGYRFQADNGFLLRLGLGWVGGLAMGPSFGLGYAF